MYKKFLVWTGGLLVVVSFLAVYSVDKALASACPLETQKAYKSASVRAVYYVTQQCTKRAFKQSSTFFTYFSSWSAVKTISPSILQAIPEDRLGFMPLGPLYSPQHGALVKTTDDAKVYLLLGTEKFWITSEEVFSKLRYSWSWIEDVDGRLLEKYTSAGAINYTDHHPNFTLVKYKDDPRVYRLIPNPNDSTKQVKEHIKDPTEFTTLQYRWDRIVVIDNSERYEDKGEVSNRPKTGCWGKSDFCHSGEQCVRDTCIVNSEWLPTNSVTSKKCANHEVFKDGFCQPAKMNLVYYSKNLDSQMMKKYIDNAVAGFVYVADAQQCRDAIRVHILPDFCFPKGTRRVQEEIWKTHGQSANLRYLKPPSGQLPAECEVGDSVQVNEWYLPGTEIHELGHILGLWDQYCYYPPSLSSPNQVNFGSAVCKPAQDEHFRGLCSQKNDTTIDPIQCVGNPNKYGGHSLMGTETGAPAPTFGFDEQEVIYLKSKLGCN